MLKSEIRIVGFDDGPFEPRTRGTVPVVGVIFRGGKFLDGLLRTDVEIDGIDATDKLVKLINSSRHKQQLKIIMLDGITLGGFNIVDVKQLHKATGLPIIVVNRKSPNLDEVRTALKKFPDFKKRWEMIENAGRISELILKNKNKIFYQSAGIDMEDAEDAIMLSTTHGNLSEPLRVAHLIATAIVRGESYGRA